jgi:hypothetical protein
LIFTLDDAGELHPATVFKYWKENVVPGVNPEIAAIVPTPVCVNPAGIEFTVQPVLGSPER